jgi:murein endopeptidase
MGANAAENNCIIHKCYLLTPKPDSGLELSGKVGNGYYGREETLTALESIGTAWKDSGATKNIVVTEISQEIGPTPGHKTHDEGASVDIRPIRASGTGGLSYKDPNYDQPATQNLVNIIKQQYPDAIIYFNDPNIVGVKPWPGHNDHLHVGFK